MVIFYHSLIYSLEFFCKEGLSFIKYLITKLRYGSSGKIGNIFYSFPLFCSLQNNKLVFQHPPKVINRGFFVFLWFFFRILFSVFY